MLLNPQTHFAPPLPGTASRKCKTHQEKLICLVCMLSKFCKSVSDKMPSFLVILQGAPRNTLIFCGIQMHSLMSRLRVQFHLFLEQGRERRDPLESSLGWQMGPTATHGSWPLKDTGVVRRWLLLIQNWMEMFSLPWTRQRRRLNGN